MAPASAEAGPSKQRSKQNTKKRAAESSSKASKRQKATPRIDDNDNDDNNDDDADFDVGGGAGVNTVDPMAALESGVDAALEEAGDADGPVTAADSALVPSVAAVRADEFEQEAEREIEASKGLGGGEEEGATMKLVHQVRHQVSYTRSLLCADRV